MGRFKYSDRLTVRELSQLDGVIKTADRPLAC